MDCEIWHDAVDEENPDEPMVMTTWHTEESINQVARFFVLDTWFEDCRRPRNYLILLIGSDPTVGDKLQRAVARLLPLRKRQ